MRDKVLLAIIAAPIFAFLVALLASLLVFRAWVLYMLWGWYALPIFSAPAVPLMAFFGALIAVGLFRTRKPDSDKSLWKTVGEHFAISGFALGFGYAGSFFV
jgi:hypothetical protein